VKKNLWQSFGSMRERKGPKEKRKLSSVTTKALRERGKIEIRNEEKKRQHGDTGGSTANKKERGSVKGCPVQAPNLKGRGIRRPFVGPYSAKE